MDSLKIIAHIETEFSEKFGVPRQSGLVESIKARIIFEPEFRNADALRGLSAFSHIWLIWGFSLSKRSNWQPTVRPPRLGGNARMGVFATRSPYRPNPIGLSAVKIDRIEDNVIHVLGADLVDGTPIYDIKPYIPYADCIEGAIGGYASETPQKTLKVLDENGALDIVPEDKRKALCEVLSLDPRPRYQDDPSRVYGMHFDEYNVKFTVNGNKLTVLFLERKSRQKEL